MKKVIILVVLMFFTLPCFSKTIECELTFDWISKSQLQRDDNIAQIQNILLAEPTVIKYQKKEFREKYSSFLKDKENKTHYVEISAGKKDDAEKIYCGFFLKNNLLIAYGIQYKNNMKNIYYYDALGNLRWVDVFSDNYPSFPYTSSQYASNGKIVASYYYVSEADQYVFGHDKSFLGRWYKEKMYNKKAKVIMTRSNY